ncbi:hypothetical protein [Microcella alkalica]|uniref:Uncharacterized protein n=1 Tax=Microcella alkalica TaxID=355930 RepID=A0A839EFP8_9MICO|nr:hypothetical protein [Microcella alkalica]MBA8848145.1 hypothetical protein [Microcella alkalica]
MMQQLSRKNTIVLLTAAVRPRAAGPLAVSDPQERLGQYRQSLLRWSSLLEVSAAEIHVVETTGSAGLGLLSLVPQPLRSRIEVISCEVDREAERRGKGAAEFHAIEKYMGSASAPDGDTTLYKVTGRLFVRNAMECITPLAQEEIRIRMTLDRTFADSRFFGASSLLWRTLLADISSKMNDEKSMIAEVVLAAEVAHAAAIGDILISRFPRRPVFEGKSGSTGEIYRQTPVRDSLLAPLEKVLARLASRKQV